MRVRIYGGIHGETAEFGATRWEVEWQEMTLQARTRCKANPEAYEHDRDRDEASVTAHFNTEQEARVFAGRILSEQRPFYGCCTVVLQRVEWFIEEDRLAEWADQGEPEYLP